ncbi:hypothetical protein G4D61_14980 [Bacillus ginsengihumi]|uniref:Uncharacterized protein n=1 Tax=Heyndrickxia ginsengihumi TaxID=363870 RepID=A0A6M0PBE6_9BACI|nr:alpha/beta hydrolase-fold protein [Heyndrickxia ginsengihumi]MBE6185565.1 hypothetical protein [Bacillus sp. (in: firmicutes)]NEY21250.1 hypothetical protein [Heyndrickxia ginsengihumi]
MRVDKTKSPIQRIDLVTNITADGEKVIAAILKFNEEINGASLSNKSFTVKASVNGAWQQRTITNVYSNHQPELSKSQVNGPYVIIELDEHDEHANTIVWNDEQYQNRKPPLNYAVSQTETVYTHNGNPLFPSDKQLRNNGEMNPIIDYFKQAAITDEFGNNLPYRLFEPKVETDQTYPLVLFLHGAGEKGNDNAVHILANKGAAMWASPEIQKQHPAFVLAPQLPLDVPTKNGWAADPYYSLLLQLLQDMQKTYPIDESRIYVTGMSMGGIGTWHFIQKNPQIFAAAIPICGQGSPSNAGIIKHMPIWAFHAADDKIVPVSGSRHMVAALQFLRSPIKYTEYPAGSLHHPHMSWIPTYEKQELVNWLFSQKKL